MVTVANGRDWHPTERIMEMAAKHARKRIRPKRSSIHMTMAALSIALVIIVNLARLSPWLQAVPSVPSLLIELIDRVMFHEDLIEQVIEQVMPR